MSVTKDNILYTRIGTSKEACVGTVDNTAIAVSKSFVGEVVILSHVTIDDIYCKVTTIGRYAFNQCKKVTNIVIPDTVTFLKQLVAIL